MVAAATTIARAMTTRRSPRRCGARGRFRPAHARVSGAARRAIAGRKPAAGGRRASGGVRRRADGDEIAGRAPGRRAQVAARAARRRARRRCAARLHGRGRAEALRALERFVAGGARARRPHLAGDPRARPRVRRGRADVAARRLGVAGEPAAARCGVMAFASARPRDGGAGATLVLLRRTEPLIALARRLLRSAQHVDRMARRPP